MFYRLFFRDPASNRVLTSRGLPGCEDDRSALLAMMHEEERNVELWAGTRLIGAIRRP